MTGTPANLGALRDVELRCGILCNALRRGAIEKKVRAVFAGFGGFQMASRACSMSTPLDRER